MTSVAVAIVDSVHSQSLNISCYCKQSLSLKPTERMPQPSGLVKLPKGKGAAGWYRFVHGREEPSNEPAAETDGTQEGDEEMDAADGADEDEADAASSDDADASAVGALLESDNVQVAPPPAETVASMPSTPDPVPTEPSPALLRRFKQVSRKRAHVKLLRMRC